MIFWATFSLGPWNQASQGIPIQHGTVQGNTVYPKRIHLFFSSSKLLANFNSGLSPSASHQEPIEPIKPIKPIKPPPLRPPSFSPARPDKRDPLISHISHSVAREKKRVPRRPSKLVAVVYFLGFALCSHQPCWRQYLRFICLSFFIVYRIIGGGHPFFYSINYFPWLPLRATHTKFALE